MSGFNPKKNAGGSAGLAPQARTASANGSSVDLAGYRGAIVVILVGTVTDGTHTPKVQHCDDNSTWVDAAASDLEGTFAALAAATNQYVGYKGAKRYIRVVSTVSGATTGGIYGAAVIKGGALQT